GFAAAPRRIRESDLEGHFTQEEASPEAGDPASKPEVEKAGDSDLQLVRALEVLKSWTYFERLRRDREATVQARAADSTR
ncbi:MAG: hypothetical protein V3T07_04775, partial [Myxococcota bacterium]